MIPGKGNYLRPATERYALVDGLDRLLRDDLLRCLRDPRLDRVDWLVSFATKSGLEQLHGGLVDALDRGARIRVLTTDYLTVTDADALARLLDLAQVRGQAIATRVFHDPATSFHPKAYLCYSADGVAAAAFVGSNNLSARPPGVGEQADYDGLTVSLDGLPAAHLRVLLDGLPVFERYGLLLAGGYAFRAHEILHRPSQDLDFATRDDTPLPEIRDGTERRISGPCLNIIG